MCTCAVCTAMHRAPHRTVSSVYLRSTLIACLYCKSISSCHDPCGSFCVLSCRDFSDWSAIKMKDRESERASERNGDGEKMRMWKNRDTDQSHALTNNKSKAAHHSRMLYIFIRQLCDIIHNAHFVSSKSAIPNMRQFIIDFVWEREKPSNWIFESSSRVARALARSLLLHTQVTWNQGFENPLGRD